MSERSKEEVWSSEGWPIYFEALVVLHSSAQAQTEVSNTCPQERVYHRVRAAVALI